MRRPRFPTGSLPLACLLLPALAASLPATAQQVYKWKDAAGVTHFTAEPPPDRTYQAREVDHHQAVPVVAGDDAPAPAPERKGEDPGCATARSNLALLKAQGKLMMDSNGDGKADKPLSDADRTKQRNLAEAMIAAQCSGSSTAAAMPAEPEEQ